ncbi:MAG: NifU family protein [Vallitaleaceae bacterium]|jgi:Fe-S cluster biogenesis protein NfuA|nr:NifU family protein [Vallitaleaceae bacterium]
MESQVLEALEQVRPGLQSDGGDVELVSIEEGIVTVRLTGRCGGCPMSQMTLKNFIESTLKAAVPGVIEVVGI